MSRTYAVHTFGCQMNEHDSERIAGLLEREGYDAADPGAAEDADLIVLNTCCVRENADNKLYGALGRLKAVKEARPQARIVVAGCLAQKDRDLIRERAPHVDVVFGTHNVHRLGELLARAESEGPVVEVWEEAPLEGSESSTSALPARREVEHAAWVTIQTGCDNSCAFCIVPAVRGPEVSRPFGEVVAEVESLVASGVVEVTLLGQNVNSYGRDITTRLRAERPGPEDVAVAGERWALESRRRPRPLFSDLLRAVGSIPGVRRVRFTSPHPKDLRPETVEAMAEVDAVCPHLHLPLQAGSDRTLRAMQRGYTVERYLERLASARSAVGDLAVTTDLIVGFPGETERDFERTLEVVAEVGYDSAFTFVFSPRPGTPAGERVDELVPREVTAERMERLRIVVERSSLARNLDRVGRTEEVLVEGPSKKDPTRLTGRTPQNKLVHFRALAPLRTGSFARCRVTEARTQYLIGEPVEAAEPADRRLRIPVVSA